MTQSGSCDQLLTAMQVAFGEIPAMKGKHCLYVILLLALTSIVQAQGNNGRGKCMQPFGISFYKVQAGHEDEWLALFMEWHYPILEYSLKHNTISEFKLNVPDGHGEGVSSFWS